MIIRIKLTPGLTELELYTYDSGSIKDIITIDIRSDYRLGFINMLLENSNVRLVDIHTNCIYTLDANEEFVTKVKKMAKLDMRRNRDREKAKLLITKKNIVETSDEPLERWI